MTPPLFTFLHQVGELAGTRIVRCNRQILANGPIGNKQQGQLYRYFVSCGLVPALLDAKGRAADIGAIRTSCAVYVGAVLYWCGSPDRARLRPGYIGWPMAYGWLGSLACPPYGRHDAWIEWTGNETPEPGAVFFIEHRGTNNNHVGFFLSELEPGVWETAEGGGGDGTECAIRRRVLTDFDDETLWDFDPKLRRELRGWWQPSGLGLSDAL